MRPTVPRGSRKKSTVQPVIITNDTKFSTKLSERTIRKRRKEKERRSKSGIFSSLNLCGVVCLYFFLILCVIIGAGGIALCAIYFNVDTNTQSWKIAGIILGIITCTIGIILILLSIFKQTRNRSRKNANEEALFDNENFYTDDGDQLNNKKLQNETREIATSPIPNSSLDSLKTNQNDLIYCSKCNRLQPYDHQCISSLSNRSEQVSTAIQTEENTTPKTKSHTIIDRSRKYATTTETQTNPTENIVYKRVPIPTTSVIIQQPTTKVMIVRVPNKAGELILQPKTTTANEK